MNMRTTLYSILPLFCAIMALSSCENDDTDFSKIIEEGQYIIKEIETDETPLAEANEQIPADDNDYVENSVFTRQVNIVFDGDKALVSGDMNNAGITVDGAHIVARPSSPMAFSLSGNSENGSFKLYSDNKQRIDLNNLTLANPSGPAINNQCGKSLYIVLAQDSENSLTDGPNYKPSGGEDMKGTIFSEGQILFSGAGSLSVTGNYKNAIASDDYILFRPGCKFTIVSTAGNGVKANDGITVNGSIINIIVSSQAAKGMNSEGHITVNGGRTTVITSGHSIVEGNDTSSCAGIKSDSTFTMHAGTLNIKSSGNGGKGINSGKKITIENGEINVVTLGQKIDASPKGIKSDEDIDINGGYLYSYSAYSKPLDAAGTLHVKQGYIRYINKPKQVEIKY